MNRETLRQLFGAFAMASAILSGIGAAILSQVTVADRKWALVLVSGLTAASVLSYAVTEYLLEPPLRYLPLPAVGLGVFGLLDMANRVL